MNYTASDFTSLGLNNFLAEFLANNKDPEVIEEFIKRHKLQSKAEWFFSKVIAAFGRLKLERNDNGLISAKKLVQNTIKNDPELHALWYLMRHSKRGSFIKGQTDKTVRNYCALVPIIMSAFKVARDVPYMMWDPSEIVGIVDPNLAEAMLFTSSSEFAEIARIENVLEERNKALMTRTGLKSGQMKKPETTYSLFPDKSSPLYLYPTLVRIMVCQTWCAHPNNRTKYMVLDPSNWDNMPEPLIKVDPILTTEEWYS